LLAILAHNRGGRPEPDADFAIAADKGAFGGNAADNTSAVNGRRAGGFSVMASKLCQ
jgi:hypothetical protein